MKQTPKSNTLLRNWISAPLVDLYEKGELRSHFLQNAPFEHFVLQNFFRDEVIHSIESYCRSIPTEKNLAYGIGRHSDLKWGPYGQLEVLKFIYSGAFREFLKALLSHDISMKSSAVPQFNHFGRGSRGLAVHNDSHDDRDVVMLLQLSRDHAPGLGGELVFHRKGGRDGGENKGGFIPVRKIAPCFNTLTLFNISDDSWHSVEDMRGDWERRLLVFDWFVPRQFFGPSPEMRQ